MTPLLLSFSLFLYIVAEIYNLPALFSILVKLIKLLFSPCLNLFLSYFIIETKNPKEDPDIQELSGNHKGTHQNCVPF